MEIKKKQKHVQIYLQSQRIRAEFTTFKEKEKKSPSSAKMGSVSQSQFLVPVALSLATSVFKFSGVRCM